MIESVGKHVLELYVHVWQSPEHPWS